MVMAAALLALAAAQDPPTTSAASAACPPGVSPEACAVVTDVCDVSPTVVYDAFDPPREGSRGWREVVGCMGAICCACNSASPSSTHCGADGRQVTTLGQLLPLPPPPGNSSTDFEESIRELIYDHPLNRSCAFMPAFVRPATFAAFCVPEPPTAAPPGSTPASTAEPPSTSASGPWPATPPAGSCPVEHEEEECAFLWRVCHRRPDVLLSIITSDPKNGYNDPAVVECIGRTCCACTHGTSNDPHCKNVQHIGDVFPSPFTENNFLDRTFKNLMNHASLDLACDLAPTLLDADLDSYCVPFASANETSTTVPATTTAAATTSFTSTTSTATTAATTTTRKPSPCPESVSEDTCKLSNNVCSIEASVLYAFFSTNKDAFKRQLVVDCMAAVCCACNREDPTSEYCGVSPGATTLAQLLPLPEDAAVEGSFVELIYDMPLNSSCTFLPALEPTASYEDFCVAPPPTSAPETTPETTATPPPAETTAEAPGSWPATAPPGTCLGEVGQDECDFLWRVCHVTVKELQAAVDDPARGYLDPVIASCIGRTCCACGHGKSKDPHCKNIFKVSDLLPPVGPPGSPQEKTFKALVDHGSLDLMCDVVPVMVKVVDFDDYCVPFDTSTTGAATSTTASSTSTPAGVSKPDDGESAGTELGIIVGASVGSVVLIVFIILLARFFTRGSRKLGTSWSEFSNPVFGLNDGTAIVFKDPLNYGEMDDSEA